MAHMWASYYQVAGGPPVAHHGIAMGGPTVGQPLLPCRLHTAVGPAGGPQAGLPLPCSRRPTHGPHAGLLLPCSRRPTCGPPLILPWVGRWWANHYTHVGYTLQWVGHPWASLYYEAGGPPVGHMRASFYHVAGGPLVAHPWIAMGGPTVGQPLHPCRLHTAVGGPPVGLLLLCSRRPTCGPHAGLLLPCSRRPTCGPPLDCHGWADGGPTTTPM